MKKIATLILVVFYFSIRAQVFNGAGGAILNNGGQETVFNLSASPVSLIDSLYGLEEVCLSITHPAVEELHVYLQSPFGTVVELSSVLSCSGSNFTATCFNNAAPTSIT